MSSIEIFARRKSNTTLNKLRIHISWQNWVNLRNHTETMNVVRKLIWYKLKYVMYSNSKLKYSKLHRMKWRFLLYCLIFIKQISSFWLKTKKVVLMSGICSCSFYQVKYVVLIFHFFISINYLFESIFFLYKNIPPPLKSAK